MEQPQILDQGNDSPEEGGHLYYSPSIKARLEISGQYAIWVAIIYSVNILIGMFGAFALQDQVGGGFATLLIGMLFGVVINFIFIYFTYQFGTHVKKGLESDAIDIVEDGIFNLSRYFKAVGVLMILPLVLFVLAFIIALVGGLFAAIS